MNKNRNNKLTVEDYVERLSNEDNAINFLKSVMKNIFQMGCVFTNEFQKHGIISRGVMNCDDLINELQLFKYLIV